jgi:hypothetical protein
MKTSMTDGRRMHSYLERVGNHGYNGRIYQSRGKGAIGLRLIPPIRDFRFAWEEMQ